MRADRLLSLMLLLQRHHRLTAKELSELLAQKQSRYHNVQHGIFHGMIPMKVMMYIQFLVYEIDLMIAMMKKQYLSLITQANQKQILFS